jgi:hypothetical protein
MIVAQAVRSSTVRLVKGSNASQRLQLGASYSALAPAGHGMHLVDSHCNSIPSSSSSR